jgi:hypothetical protein
MLSELMGLFAELLSNWFLAGLIAWSSLAYVSLTGGLAGLDKTFILCVLIRRCIMLGHQLDKTQAGMDSVHFRENQFQGKTGARSLVHDLFSVYTSEFQ